MGYEGDSCESMTTSTTSTSSTSSTSSTFSTSTTTLLALDVAANPERSVTSERPLSRGTLWIIIGSCIALACMVVAVGLLVVRRRRQALPVVPEGGETYANIAINMQTPLDLANSTAPAFHARPMNTQDVDGHLLARSSWQGAQPDLQERSPHALASAHEQVLDSHANGAACSMQAYPLLSRL